MSGEKIYYSIHDIYSVEIDENKITKIIRRKTDEHDSLSLYDSGTYNDTVKYITINKSALINKRNGISNYSLKIYAKNNNYPKIIDESEYSQEDPTYESTYQNEAKNTYDVKGVKFNTVFLTDNMIYCLCEVVDSYIIDDRLNANNIKLVVIMRNMTAENDVNSRIYDNLMWYLHNSGRYDIVVYVQLKSDGKSDSNTVHTHPTNNKKIKLIDGFDRDELRKKIKAYLIPIMNYLYSAEICFIYTHKIINSKDQFNKMSYMISYTKNPMDINTDVEVYFLCNRWDIFTNGDGYKSGHDVFSEPCFRFIIADHDKSGTLQKFVKCLAKHEREAKIRMVSLTDNECLLCEQMKDTTFGTTPVRCSDCLKGNNNIMIMTRNKNRTSFIT